MQNIETRCVTSPEAMMQQKIDFGLIFFSSNETPVEQEKYRLVLDSARFADQHGFSSIWIPERHFTQEGKLYPSPAILQAALATQTQRIQLRAGSVVLPLHNPIQIAEEWAMIDNLSGGRVGISFASGWHPNDFVLNPDNYAQRNESMYADIEIVRKLWRGETIWSRAGNGQMAEIQTYPAPLQRELPFWITAAGNPKTFATAGRIGANLLTHLYNQSIEELAEKIQIYRDARRQHGYDPATGQVSVMLHTFVGPDEETVRAQLQGPFCAYLRSATHLLGAIAHSLGQKVDLDSLSPQNLDDYLSFVFELLISNQRVLFGTPESCLTLVKQLQSCGVNEIACQMDFGVPTEFVLRSLPYLADLKEQANVVTFYQEDGLDLSEMRVHTEVLFPDTTQSLQSFSQQALSGSPLEKIQQRCQTHLAPSQLYQQIEQHGLQLSGPYQAISDVWYTTDEALGLININGQDDEMSKLYQLPVALLDTCCLLLWAALPPEVRSATNVSYLPGGMHELLMHQTVPLRLWSHAQLSTPLTVAETQTIIGNVALYTDDGICIAEIFGLQLQPIEITATTPAPIGGSLDELLLLNHPIIAPENREANASQGQSAVLLPRQRILAAAAAQRYQLLAEYLHLQLAQVLQLPPGQLDPDQSFASFGLDSLMALDLKHQLEFQLSIHIPVVTLLQGPSIAQLTTSILEQFAAEEQTQSGTHDSSSDATLIQQEHLLQQLDQRAPHNVAELVQNLISATAQAPQATNQQPPAAALDQLTDTQIELLLQQIAEGNGNSHDAK